MTADNNLFRIFQSGRFAHSWIIGGDAPLALKKVKDFAQGVFASNLPIEHNPNFYIVELQDNASGNIAKHIGVDQIRKLQSFLSTKNGEGRYKIAVIYKADLMNVNAANCCLKLLEEPGEGNIIFLLTSSPHSMLPTIRSRCQKMAVNASIVQEDYTELLKYIKDHQLFIQKLSGKIDKDFVVDLARSAMAMIRDGVTKGEQSSVDLLHKFGRITKITHNLTHYDLDPKASFIMLIEELSY
ncbi:MAG: hypothetical protein V4485_05275 [Pseudomonadota bacterium]